MKYKILFQLNSLGYGGTEKAVLSLLQNLDLNKFTPYVFVVHKKNYIKFILRYFISVLSRSVKCKFQNKYVIPLVRRQQFEDVVGVSHIYFGDSKKFIQVVNSLRPDIIHFNRGDWNSFYSEVIRLIPTDIHCVETCIFGREPSQEYFKRLSKFYFVSHWLISKSTWQKNKGVVLYNPIKHPASSANLRNELKLGGEKFVIGRIARPNMFSDDLFLIDVIKKLGTNCTLLIVAASDELKRSSEMLDNVIFLEPTIDEELLSKFYNTIDLLLHRRIDGETFGMNIAEAMMHEKPVVSHFSSIDNAQVELLDSSDDGVVGCVAEENNLQQYVECIKKFMDNRGLLKDAGQNAITRALRLYSENVITSKLECEYIDLLKSK